MNRDRDSAEHMQAIGEAAEALWDATRRAQDILDELEEERVGRWAAYAAFREVGAVFRFALERLQMESPLSPEISTVIAAYRAGARAGLEGAADLAEAMEQSRAPAVEQGIQRLALASQQFVRGRYLLQRYLDGASRDPADDSED